MTETENRREATLLFAEQAFLKMMALVYCFGDREVAWHGVVEKGEDDSMNKYYVMDILVYPQTTTTASVDMDVTQYDEWIRDNIEDERFNKLFMHGHSHVNMMTSPSSTDIEHQENIIKMLGKDGFYVFLIWNRRNEYFVKIVDKKKDVVFDTNDVGIGVISDFLIEAKHSINSCNGGMSYA